MRNYLVEFIGTFFLVLTICTVSTNATIGPLAPIAIGATLMVMVFAGGHVSGAHYNPAVTLAVFLRGKLAAREVPGYWAAQIFGAIAAAGVAIVLQGGMATPAAGRQLLPAIIAEFVATFALAYVVLNVATAKATSGNSFYGLAIGFTVMAMAYAVGSVSGGVFNPAVGVGVSVMGLSAWSFLWVYFLANFAGGAAAALVFKGLNRDDR